MRRWGHGTRGAARYKAEGGVSLQGTEGYMLCTTLHIVGRRQRVNDDR